MGLEREGFERFWGDRWKDRGGMERVEERGGGERSVEEDDFE